MKFNLVVKKTISLLILIQLLVSCEGKLLFTTKDLDHTNLIISESNSVDDSLAETIHLVNGQEKIIYALINSEEDGVFTTALNWSISNENTVSIAVNNEGNVATLSPLQTGSVKLTIEALGLSRVFNLIVSEPAQTEPDLVLTDNWVKVPANAGGMLLPEFYVMKYEAKAWEDINLDGGIQASEGNPNYIDPTQVLANPRAISSRDFMPWLYISPSKAQEKCEEIGEGFHLISNAEYQAIARDVEVVDSNWSSGLAGDGCVITKGVNDSTPADCEWHAAQIEIVQTNGQTNSFYSRANFGSHFNEDTGLRLSNGETIYNLTLYPMFVDMDTDTTGVQGIERGVGAGDYSQVNIGDMRTIDTDTFYTETGVSSNMYLPSFDNIHSFYAGLGTFSAFSYEGYGNYVQRGGASGLFSVLSSYSNSPSSSTTFRCVYRK
ncbi:hypothetical protein [Halobacteriovorax sp. ZH2_bin.1]|uniref:hypothetical protein n=1 Tax=unclassified Halobacteriovorax TaxID=2639665 RepID=UPI003723373D